MEVCGIKYDNYNKKERTTMKQKKFGRKLRLNKETIALLNDRGMVKVVGGATVVSVPECCCDTTEVTNRTCPTMVTCATCVNPCPVPFTESPC
jgi:hypothetical protein